MCVLCRWRRKARRSAVDSHPFAQFTDAFTVYGANPTPQTQAALIATADDLALDVVSIGKRVESFFRRVQRLICVAL
jgi:hypothetical protein